MSHRTIPIDARTARHVCVAADCDPRTLRRLLTGRRVQPASRRRIIAALRRLGLLAVVPPGVIGSLGPLDLRGVEPWA